MDDADYEVSPAICRTALSGARWHFLYDFLSRTPRKPDRSGHSPQPPGRPLFRCGWRPRHGDFFQANPDGSDACEWADVCGFAGAYGGDFAGRIESNGWSGLLSVGGDIVGSDGESSGTVLAGKNIRTVRVNGSTPGRGGVFLGRDFLRRKPGRFQGHFHPRLGDRRERDSQRDHRRDDQTR